MIAPLRTLALTCAVALALTACKKEEQQAPPPPEVGVIEAKPQTLPLQRELVGRLSPFRSADVRARVPGVLLKRVYQEGSDVKEGQVLFLIDPAPLRAALNASQAELASAQATAANARAAANRARSLAPQAYVSKSDL
ncbi:MAG: biotin/lipoyl-binding protein, partial [Stenotrophomonas maltophilia]